MPHILKQHVEKENRKHPWYLDAALRLRDKERDTDITYYLTDAAYALMADRKATSRPINMLNVANLKLHRLPIYSPGLSEAQTAVCNSCKHVVIKDGAIAGCDQCDCVKNDIRKRFGIVDAAYPDGQPVQSACLLNKWPKLKFPTIESKPAAMEIYVGGYPGHYGGADTELLHQVYLWRSYGVRVVLVPFNSPTVEMRKLCDGLGCETVPYSPCVFRNRIVVSFCSGEFLKRLPEIWQHAPPREVIWFNCMTWLFDAEKEAHRRGQITQFGYQTTYQRNKLVAELETIAPVKVFDYEPFYKIDSDNPLVFDPVRDKGYFGIGRISRDDANKYPADMWQTFAAVKAPKPVKAFVLGFGDKAKSKCGSPPPGLDWLTWGPGGVPAADFYSRIHAMIHQTGGSRENYPRVLLEAWSAGVIPIVEDDYAFPDLIENGVTGFRCKTSTEAAEKATMLAYDDAMRQRMAQAGYQRLRETAGDKGRCWESWAGILSGQLTVAIDYGKWCEITSPSP